MRCQPFQPSFVVGVQPLLVIVDENGRGNVHGIDERYALLNIALLQGGLDLRSDIEKRPSPRRFEPQLLAKRPHGLLSGCCKSRWAPSLLVLLPCFPRCQGNCDPADCGCEQDDDGGEYLKHQVPKGGRSSQPIRTARLPL